jgi:hypothetical protein
MEENDVINVMEYAECEYNLPYELSYGLRPASKYDLDETKILYQNEYKSYEYYARRFPYDYSHLKGFDAVIQLMADNALTPLEELEIIKLNSNIIDEQHNRHDSIISE